MTDRDTARRGKSKIRLWLFRATSVGLVPLVFLLVAEGSLRALYVGYPAGFTVECGSPAEPARCDNSSFSRRFFPSKIARTAEPFVFRSQKPDETVRIFLVGASAAQGDPEPTYGAGRILTLLLEERYPGVRFEVVNAAVTAINSHVVLPIVAELSRYDADLFIVYLGHNEVVGPFGAGTVFSPLTAKLSLIRARIGLGSTRIGQLLARATAGIASDLPDEWGGMEMFLEHRVAAGDPRLDRVHSHFRRNLEAIVDRATDSGSRVLLSTVATNLRDSAPFASLHRDGLGSEERREWDRSFALGELLEAEGRPDEAHEAYLAATEIDGDYAELHYRLGKLQLEAGEADRARSHLESASELDALRFRADRGINEIIREVARARSGPAVRLADAANRIASNGTHGIPGEESFHEHVHLNFAGNYLLAREFLEQGETLLPGWVRERAVEVAPPTESQCAARLAYTEFDRRRVLSDLRDRLRRAPFSQQSDADERMARLDSRIREIESGLMKDGPAASALQYAEAITRSPDDPWLRRNHARFLAETGRHDAAIEELRAFLAALPQAPGGREELSSLFAAQGRFEESIEECRRLIALQPAFTKPYYTMAYALGKLERLDLSIGVYRELLVIDPGATAEIYNEIGRIQIHANRTGEAIESYRTAIAHNESHGREPIPDLHYNYGFALKLADLPRESMAAFRNAAESYDEVFDESSGSIAALLAAGNAWIGCDEYREGARRFLRATRIEPTSMDAHLGLIRAYELGGMEQEAVLAAEQGIVALTNAGRTEQVETLRLRRDRLRARD